MTPKQTALRNTLIAVAAALFGSLVMGALIVLFTPAQLGISLLTLGILWLAKMFYDSEVERLEILERLNEK
jgi:hypothetical protein